MKQRARMISGNPRETITGTNVIQHLALLPARYRLASGQWKGSMRLWSGTAQECRVYLEFSRASENKGKKIVKSTATYFECIEKIPAVSAIVNQCAFSRLPLLHGGLWVDYDTMTKFPDCTPWAKRNFADHGGYGWR